ncbi:MAG: sigma-70 family RNA polymerase sigma factor, partial [Myxococcales bacterium]|nr:sigma-70 family RNA polymerase sigma factor [Myxococcales bacterium]
FAAWCEGDARAGSMLFDRHYPVIARYFLNKVPDAYQADLVQATFLAAVEGRARFRGDASIRGYLLGVAHHLLCRHYRSHRGKSVDLSQVTAADLGPSASQQLGARKEQQLLLQALRSIPLELQEVLELHYWEGLDTAQVGEIVGIPRGTVKSRMSRGRRLLREQLGRLSHDAALVESTVGNLEQWAKGLREQLGAREPEVTG